MVTAISSGAVATSDAALTGPDVESATFAGSDLPPYVPVTITAGAASGSATGTSTTTAAGSTGTGAAAGRAMPDPILGMAAAGVVAVGLVAFAL